MPPTAEAIWPPLPQADRLTAFFWNAVDRHQLEILRCANGHYVHYPRIVCPRCQSEDLTPTPVSGRGTLYSYTWSHQAFHPYWADKLPYLIAIVELVEENGLRLTSTVIDCPPEALRVGLELEVTFREIESGLTLPLFRPALAADEGSS